MAKVSHWETVMDEGWTLFFLFFFMAHYKFTVVTLVLQCCWFGFSPQIRCIAFFGDSFLADMRPRWGAALQLKQTGGSCAPKHKHHPYWLKHQWLL